MRNLFLKCKWMRVFSNSLYMYKNMPVLFEKSTNRWSHHAVAVLVAARSENIDDSSATSDSSARM